MNKIAARAFAFLLMLSIGMGITPNFVYAQSVGAKTYVSSTGTSVASCSSPAEACITFARAIQVAGVGGEVICLDSGFFGTISIFSSVTINCKQSIGQVGFNFVTVNLPADGVAILDGIDIDLRRIPASTPALTFGGAGTLHLRNSRIAGGGVGIAFKPTGVGRLFIKDTVIEGNSDIALRVEPTGSGSALVTIDGLSAVGNAGGVYTAAFTANNSVRAEIRNSNLSQNGFGFYSRSAAGGFSTAWLDNTSISNNSDIGIRSRGSNSKVFLGRSSLTGNTTGLLLSEGGAASSYGNNVVSNVAPGGVLSGPAGLQ